jgi:predicted nucleic acid-binding protein
VSAVLDSGALIAIDKGDRKIGAMLRVLQRDGVPLHTSAAVVAQVWRDGRRQVNLARILPGVAVDAVDDLTAKRVGELLAANGTNDVADAHVALLGRAHGTVLTSDEPDIRALLRTRRITADIVRV